MLDQISLLASQTMLISVPLVLAALGGTSSERSGVVNIALEGVLLGGAFAAATVGWATGSATLGIFAEIGAGVFISMIHAVLSIVLRADQIISGLAINLFVAGASEYGSHVVWPAVVSRGLPALSGYRAT